MKKLKTLLLTILAFLLIGGGLFAYKEYKDRNKKVQVQAVANMNLGWLDDGLKSTGMVYEKESQTVNVDPSQIVKEVYVTEGQAVKAGDPLLLYDFESQQLAVEVKRLEVERARVRIGTLQQELAEIRNMKPYVPTPVPTYEPEPEPTPMPRPDKKKEKDAYTVLDDLSTVINKDAAGTAEDPLRFLVSDSGIIYGDFFKALGKSGKVAIVEVREGNTLDGELIVSHTFNGKHLRDYDKDEAFYARTLENANGSGSAIFIEDNTNPYRMDGFKPSGGEDNNGSNNDGSNNGEGEASPPVIIDGEDDSSGYTAQEIAEMAYDKQREIESADLSYRKLQLELKIMEEELGDGIVRAKKDGIVKIAHGADDIPQDGSPFIKISSGEGVMIMGSISEMLLDRVKVGQALTASSWENGQEYTATVASIDDYPANTSYFYGGEGNPNASYYNFYAYMDDAEDIPENSYLEISFDTSGEVVDSMFIPQAYIRSDALGKYVMKDDNGVLKKQYVKAGKTYWGEYTQVLSGLSNEDYIAFPYGDGAIEGVKTEISEEEVYY